MSNPYEVVTIELSIFSDLSNLTGNGGAIFLENCFAVVSHCTIIKCAAIWGGGIYSSESEISIIFSDFRSDRCTYVPDSSDLGGNAICANEGKQFVSGYSSFQECAPSRSDHGESVIIAHVSQCQVSYLNISSCYGISGAFVSIRKTEIDSQLSYINAIDSYDYTTIEHINWKGHLLRSNFLRNTMTSLFIARYIDCEECVFIDNSNVDYDRNFQVNFTNCFGRFPDNTNVDGDVQTIQFPKYRFLVTRRCFKEKNAVHFIYGLLLLNIFNKS